MPARIGVLGAGGMGSAYAAFLTAAGHDVVLIGRGSSHIRRLAEQALRVVPPDAKPYDVSVSAAVHAAALPASSLDVLFILTKTYDTAQALSGAAHALAPDGVAVSLQNGLGNDAVVAEVVGGFRALVGVTTVGATLQSPGEISITASTATGRSLTHIGAMGRALAAHRGDDVCAVLGSSDLPTLHASDVAKPVWSKLALSVMSPISSLLRMTVGRVWASADGRALVEQMFDEVVLVAAAERVSLDRTETWTHASQVFAGTGEHYTSMCTDVMRGRTTEVASMAGEVFTRGAAAGIPTPVHATALSLLAALGIAGASPALLLSLTSKQSET